MIAGLEPERVESGNERRNPGVPRPVGEAQLAVDDRQRLGVARDARNKARPEVKHGPAFDRSAELAAPRGDDASLQGLPRNLGRLQVIVLPRFSPLRKLLETTKTNLLLVHICSRKKGHGEDDSRGSAGDDNREVSAQAGEAAPLEYADGGPRPPGLAEVAR